MRRSKLAGGGSRLKLRQVPVNAGAAAGAAAGAGAVLGADCESHSAAVGHAGRREDEEEEPARGRAAQTAVPAVTHPVPAPPNPRAAKKPKKLADPKQKSFMANYFAPKKAAAAAAAAPAAAPQPAAAAVRADAGTGSAGGGDDDLSSAEDNEAADIYGGAAEAAVAAGGCGGVVDLTADDDDDAASVALARKLDREEREAVQRQQQRQKQKQRKQLHPAAAAAAAAEQRQKPAVAAAPRRQQQQPQLAAAAAAGGGGTAARQPAVGELEVALQKHFGHKEFRCAEQRAAIACVLKQRDCVLLMPTGMGKSLCFQLPACILNERAGSLTVVVSPLLALMSEQVKTLRGKGKNARMINSLLSSQERKAVFAELGSMAAPLSQSIGSQKGLQLLYVTPESLTANNEVQQMLQKIKRHGRLGAVHSI